MRKLIAILAFAFSLSASAVTWTFHGFQDNFYAIKVASFTTPIQFVEVDLDFGADLAGFQSSLIAWWGFNGDAVEEVPANTPAVVEGVPDSWRIRYLVVAQGFPDYNGTWSQIARTDLSPGEYWVDFAPDGSYRVSATEPADFGKWAWDGSINPSWVEPLSTIEPTGKKLGHRNKK